MRRRGGRTPVLIYRWLGFWAIRRAYWLLLANDPRPMRERLTHEARRLLVGAAITMATIVVLVIAGVVALVWAVA